MIKSKKLFYLFLGLLLLNLVLWSIIIERVFFKEKIVFLDIGQGDSEIIINKGGNILIDAGSKKVVEKIEKELPLFEKTIDIFILSHPDRDHFLGIFDVLERYKIRAIILKDLSKSDSLYHQFLEEIKKRKILVLVPKESLKIHWLKKDNVLVFSTEKLKKKSTSQHSLIALYQFKNFNILFTGDIDQYLEKQLIPILQKIVKKIDILKVAHHGSKNSSSKEFLEAFKPLYAVIETGFNNYGHPHQEAIDRLKEVGSFIFRTDLDGSIVFLEKNNQLIYFLKKDKI